MTRNIKADLIFTMEDYAPINNVISHLSLDIDDVLIVCSELFIQRWIHNFSDEFNEQEIINIENSLLNSKFIKIPMYYKNKYFMFSFILLTHEEHKIQHPMKGEQIINIGMNKI